MKKLLMLSICLLLGSFSFSFAYTSVTMTSSGTEVIAVRQTPLELAHARAFENNITSIESLNWFRPENRITREQAAKMMVQFARVTLGDDYFFRIEKNASCDFTDKNTISKDLRTYVIESCYFGIFKGSQKLFEPKGNLTKYQTNVVLERISGKKISGGTDEFITRGDVVIQMFDLVH